MPSKALLHSAEMLALTRRLDVVGVQLPGPARFDWPVVRERTRALSADFAGAVARRTEGSKRFTLIRGAAAFVGPDRLALDGGKRTLAARGWVIATGSQPVVPPVPGLDAIPHLVSDDVFSLDAIPPSVAVLGGGAVGVEMGQFLARAGAEVHLIEARGSLAGLVEGPLLDALAEALGRELRLHRRTTAVAVRQEAGETVLTLEADGARSELRVARVLVAVGRRPALASLALERAGVRVERGVPVHDQYLRTTNPAMFVAGDAAGPPALLHTASLQGHAAGHNAARPDDLQLPALDPRLAIVFSDPSVATVGLDPASAARAGYRTTVARRPWSDQGKARLIDQTDGVAQLVVDRATRKILGCQIVGPSADLLIHMLAYAIQLGATVDTLTELHHYHPTLAEMIPSLAQAAIREIDGGECDRGDVAPCPEMQ
jgi:pyruvate/2-oxoglutarate dehydrogenase complex dihydrolipoamide dehydrogenase (E3) component